jgi:CRP-like cAMP-binding protein
MVISDLTIYDILLKLPLFQGMGANEIGIVISTVKMDFTTYDHNKVIIHQDQLCDGFYFILKGNVIMRTDAYNHKYTITEIITSPNVLQPEVLFGLRTRYTHDFLASGKTQCLYIPKNDVTNKLLNNEVFRLNMLNMISTQIQRNELKLQKPLSGTKEQQIINFLLRNVDYPAGMKIINIKMEDLAYLLDETRINISKALNNLEKLNLIELKRKEIVIPSFEKLLTSDVYHNNNV